MAPHLWEPPQTATDLHVERERLPWYWRALACLSVWLMCAGFVAFPLALDLHEAEAHGIALSIIAGSLLGVGCFVSVVVSFICRSWLFQLDHIFLPSVGASAIGLFNVLVNIANGSARLLNSLTITVLGLAAFLTFIYTVASLLLYRRIAAVRRADSIRRQRGTHMATTSRNRRDSSSTSPSFASYDHLAAFVPEDELQRRQLLSLLQQKEDAKKPSKGKKNHDADSSTVDLLKSTFRIDLPHSVNPGRDGARYLAIPQGGTSPQNSNHPTYNNNHYTPPSHTPSISPQPSPPPPILYQQAQTIHEFPPTSDGVRGWGRTSSPPPQAVRMPSSRELRRAEIELGFAKR